jgi:hypothetical protein
MSANHRHFSILKGASTIEIDNKEALIIGIYHILKEASTIDINSILKEASTIDDGCY